MNKITASLLIILFSGIALYSQTEGELTVSLVTSSSGGNYAPKNVLAIWIEDEGGDFVKTLLVNADKRKKHLNNWEASTATSGNEYNDIDAISGATNSSHSPKDCAWSGTDYNGTIAPDGTYNLLMELTDKNSTGNYSSFSFNKGANVDSQKPSDEPSFSAIAISWIPSTISGVSENSNVNNYIVYPNPGNGFYKFTGKNIKEVEIRNMEGKLISKSNVQDIDISKEKDGIYLIFLKTDKKTIIKKLIKK